MSNADETKLTGNETPEELIKRMNKIAEEQLKKVGFTENIKQALDFARAMVEYKKKALLLREAMRFIGDEKLEIPESYGKHAKELEMSAQKMRPKIPESVDLAFQDMNHERLLGFIEGIPVMEEDETRDKEEYLVLVKNLTDAHKEQIYHTLREKPITEWIQAERVQEFELNVLKYSFDFAREHLMDELPEDTEVFFDFLQKHTDGYTKKISETLEWLDDMRDGYYTNETIEKRALITLGRFGIKGKDQEEHDKLKQELIDLFQDYFTDSPKNRGELDAVEAEAN